MKYQREGFSEGELLQLHRRLLYPRLIEEKMLILLRQGKIGKWFSGIGQEAIAVGSTLAMDREEWIFPMHRNLGVFTSRDMSLQSLFLQWQGHPDAYTRGRERSFHFGSSEHRICGMISHLGPQLSLACGAALGAKLEGRKQAVLAFTGEGGTSEGEFHEAMNLASVWDLPVIFLIENNGYALSTPSSLQYRCHRLADRAAGYGMEARVLDGNNILEMLRGVREARSYCLEQQRPILLECLTFRMRGHEEASGTRYVPRETLEAWAEKDPLRNYEAFLEREGLLSREALDETTEALRAEIAAGIEAGLSYEARHPWKPSEARELSEVYAPQVLSSDSLKEAEPDTLAPARELRLLDALREGLDQGLQLHPNLVLMGQDIGAYGGAFKVTEGLMEKYGTERVRDTPLCESAVLGAALGLSLEGKKSMVEMQFADFVSCGFNQIVNNLAYIHYRWGQNADVVVRLPCGGSVSAGPFHSQSPEAWFTRVPGLKVLYPSSAADAKGLLLAALEDPGPVLLFEHKALYRSRKDPVPEQAYRIALGKARLLSSGSEASILTYGLGVSWALDYQAAHPERSLDILDLRSLAPLDWTAVEASVRRTGRVLVLHEDHLTGGLGGELAAHICEHCFEWLDAPPMRCASLDTPIPFHPRLEAQYLASSRLDACLKDLLSY